MTCSHLQPLAVSCSHSSVFVGCELGRMYDFQQTGANKDYFTEGAVTRDYLKPFAVTASYVLWVCYGS